MSGEKYVIDKDRGTLLIKNLDHRVTFGDVTCIASNVAGSSVANGHLSVLRKYLIFLGIWCHYEWCISCLLKGQCRAIECQAVEWNSAKGLNLKQLAKAFKFGRDTFQTNFNVGSFFCQNPLDILLVYKKFFVFELSTKFRFSTRYDPKHTKWPRQCPFTEVSISTRTPIGCILSFVFYFSVHGIRVWTS